MLSLYDIGCQKGRKAQGAVALGAGTPESGEWHGSCNIVQRLGCRAPGPSDSGPVGFFWAYARLEYTNTGERCARFASSVRWLEPGVPSLALGILRYGESNDQCFFSKESSAIPGYLRGLCARGLSGLDAGPDDRWRKRVPKHQRDRNG